MSLRLPWFVKIGGKLVLSRLPLGYGLWRRLNLFAHGAMHKPEYATGVFRRHFDRSVFPRKDGGFVALEIGPGDSLLSALAARAHGASRTHLVDAGGFATENLAVYREMEAYLRERGLDLPTVSDASSVQEVLTRFKASYATEGLESLRQIPSASVDFVWSQAVLEHVRRGEFLDMMRELRRVLTPGGICSHRIDLKDHLGGSLNNMRLSSGVWEAEWMASSGFYTNRLRFPEMIAMFEQAGFTVEVVEVNRWTRPPLARRSMAAEFQRFADDELLVKEFDVLLRVA